VEEGPAAMAIPPARKKTRARGATAATDGGASTGKASARRL
jgi:hypothetical protein